MFSSYIYFFLKPFTILQKVCQPQKTNVCRARAMASKYIIKQKRKGSGPISRVLCHPLAHSASLFL